MFRQSDLRRVERVALRHQDLTADDVDAGHLFRDRVLDLDPRVHLDEVILARIDVEEKLDSPGVFVADRPTDCQGRLTELPPHGRIEIGGRGNFDNLLMTPLQ